MFKDRLRSARIARGRTLQETADAVGIALRSYQKYESGDSEPPYISLIALADYLNVPTDFLLECDQYLDSLGVCVDVPREGPPRHPTPQRSR